MSRRAKIWLGWAAFGPLFAIGQLLLVMVVTEVAAACLPKSVLTAIKPTASVVSSALLFYCMACWGVGGIACLVATAICQKHFNAQPIKFWHKLRWQIIWMLWPLATPAYWYYFIWREQKFEAPPLNSAKLGEAAMSRRAKVWLGWAAFSPYIFLAIVVLVSLIAPMPPTPPAPAKTLGSFPVQGWVVLGAFSISMLVSAFAASTFQRHLKAQNFPVWQERRWNLFLQFFWLFAIGVYWYRFVRGEEAADSTAASGPWV